MTGGSTYTLRGWRAELFPGNLNFTIQPFAEAVNDECGAATPISLSVGSPTSITQDTKSATQSMTSPTCESGSFNDVWYSFTMPVTGNLVINGGFFDGTALYDGCGGSELSCFTNDGMVFSLTAGNTYLLRCWRSTSYPGPISLGIEPFEAIPNDDCANAMPISVSTACSGATNTIELRGATQSSSTPSCESAPITDGWFVFDSPIDGDIFVKNTDLFSYFAFYDGCPLTQADLDNPLACFSHNGTLSGVTFGQTIYLQVFRKQQYPNQASFCLEGAYAVADPGATTCLTGNASIDNTNNNQWVPILDGSGQLIASIKANGENLGAVTADVYNDANAVSTYMSQPFLRRKVIITPTTQPSNPVSVRLYMLQGEFDDLASVDPNLSYISQLEVVKNSQSGCASAYDGSGDFILTNGQAYGDDYYIQFNVNSFSSFFPSSVSLAPLPIELVQFTGESVKGANRLKWITASEENASQFMIEYSTDGHRWEAVGQVAAKGNTHIEQVYQFIHSTSARLSYYRLKMVDLDGTFEYSDVISLTETKQGGVVLAPNPAQNQLQLASSQSIHYVEILDAYGRVLSEKAGDDIQRIDISHLSSGIYYLRIDQSQIARFSKL